MSEKLKTTGTAATDINVKAFRLLYQWPLFVVPKEGRTGSKAIKDCVNKSVDALNTKGSGWSEVSPLNYPGFASPTKRHAGLSPAYGEFLYFHDFVQKFLFPREGDDNAAFILFENTRFKTVECQIDNDLSIYFNVERHSLHLFPSGIAVVTVELLAKGQLNLAETMKTMDRLRRSYVPFFYDGFGKPGLVPDMVTLSGCNSPVVSYPPDAEQAHGFLRDAKKRKNPQLRPTILKHWQALSALLEQPDVGGQWRDLSDERLPFNAFISLTDHNFSTNQKYEKSGADLKKYLGTLSDAQKETYAKDRDTYSKAKKLAEWDDRAALQQIRDGDWMRLAEVDAPGDNAFAYNPDFLEPLKDQVLYDRFFPHEDTGGNATRHIFSAAHYCAVGAGEFFDGLVADHWRRHYAHLTLIARFEQASLLAISSRISQIAHDHDPDGGESADQVYENALLDMQKQFALFEHRFRFTGVSSQIQPTEMFARLRAVMGLDDLYGDVKNEVEQAAAQVMALQQTRAAYAATRLNQLATIGLFLALVVGAAGMNLFVGLDFAALAGGILREHAMQMSAVVLSVAIPFVVFLWCIPGKRDKYLERFSRALMFAASVSVLIFIMLYLAG